MLPGFPPQRPTDDEDPLLEDMRVAVLDFETTGLYPHQGDEIIELAACRVDGFAVRDDGGYQALVNPGRPVSKAAFRVHGISDEELRLHPPLDVHLRPFMDYVADRVLVGQNVVFDLSFLAHSLKRRKLPLSWRHVLDTRWLARIVLPDLSHFGLDKIGARLGIEPAGVRHRAMGDVLFTVDIFLALLERCRASGLRRLGDILEAYEELEGGRSRNPALVDLLEECMRSRKSVVIHYTKASSARRTRRRTPAFRKVDIYYTSPPYFIAYCHVRRGIRTFRMDRVKDVEVLDEAYEIPHPFYPEDHFMRWSK